MKNYQFATVGRYEIVLPIPQDSLNPAKLALISLAGLGAGVTTIGFSTTSLITVNVTILTFVPLLFFSIGWSLHSFVVRALRCERQQAELRVLSDKLRKTMWCCCIPVVPAILFLVFCPTGFLHILGCYLLGTAIASGVLCLIMRLETDAQLRFVKHI